MAKYGVVKTGGKQYLVKENDNIIVDRLDGETNTKIELETLARFDTESGEVELGTPFLETKIKAVVVEHLKGDKIRVARFKAKVRYRKVKGFRSSLTQLRIEKV